MTYDSSFEGEIIFTVDNWFQDQSVTLKHVEAGSAVLTIEGSTSGDYDVSDTLTYYRTPGGPCNRQEGTNDPNECECPEDVPVKCDSNFCSASDNHCTFIRGTSDQSNMDPGRLDEEHAQKSGRFGVLKTHYVASDRVCFSHSPLHVFFDQSDSHECTLDAAAPQSCSAWALSLSWMPPGYRSNLQAWCETGFPDSYTEDQLAHYACIVREVQEAVDAIPSGFKSAVVSMVASTPLYRPEAAAQLYDDLLNGFGGYGYSLASKLRDGFLAAYDTCCCAVSPGKLSGWLAATPLEVNSDVVQANTILFGVCEDRAEMGDEPGTIDGYVGLTRKLEDSPLYFFLFPSTPSSSSLLFCFQHSSG